MTAPTVLSAAKESAEGRREAPIKPTVLSAAKESAEGRREAPIKTTVLSAAKESAEGRREAPIKTAALKFRDAYHARADLLAEHTDWSPTIALVATDTGEAVALTLKAGRVVACDTGSAGDLIVRAEARVLIDILELRLGPNGPYLFGDLTVRGAEADFVRLDYLASRLCPA